MPHPRARRLMIRQIGAKVLQQAPEPWTNVAESERTNSTAIQNLQNLALYSKNGLTPSFSDGITGLFSNVVSNGNDSVWTFAGLTGETGNAGVFSTSSMSGSVGIFGGSKHYMMPANNGSLLDLSASSVAGPFIVYSYDSQYASGVPRYQNSSLSTITGISFNKNVTGSGSPTHVVVYVAGELPPSSAIYCTSPANPLSTYNAKVSTNNFATVITGGASASASDLSSSNYRKAFLISTASINSGGGLFLGYITSDNTSTTPYKGFVVTVSSGSYT